MPRSGLTPTTVVATATKLADRNPGTRVTFAQLAGELGVKPPSLYNHVDGVDGLERLMAIDGILELSDRCRTAVMGTTGAAAIDALAHAYRTYAIEHPGVYPLTQVARPGDEEYEAAAARLLEPVQAILAGFEVAGDDLIHAIRAVRSALHGFALLESGSGFGLEVDVDESFRWMTSFLVRALS
jgi:AcrR family transcriptional regulator